MYLAQAQKIKRLTTRLDELDHIINCLKKNKSSVLTTPERSFVKSVMDFSRTYSEGKDIKKIVIDYYQEQADKIFEEIKGL